MSRSFGSNVARAAGFVALTTGLLVLALAVASKTRCGAYTVLQCAAQNFTDPGRVGQSLRRFREAERRGHTDIVVLGSSHAYRGFDPRIFAAAGLSLMNLGSTGQTPLNSYYIAERYLAQLSPKLVIFEVYFELLSRDGLESTRDLTVNTAPSWPMTKMAFATANLGAVTFSVAKALRFAAGESSVEQRPIAGETYVEGGYCEVHEQRTALTKGGAYAVHLVPAQLDWLVAATTLARTRGAEVVWVSHPLPADYRARIANASAVRDAIDRAALRARSPYWDFGETQALDALADFKDHSHLNASGVAKFDRALLERLRSAHLLE